nr:hypothetical protein [uncultured Allomuricauda sp.]
MDTLKVDYGSLRMGNLHEGKSVYLVYTERNGVLLDNSIWERELRVEEGSDGKIHITQKWKNQDPKKGRTIYSVSDYKTFRPIYHYTKNGEVGIEAFDFQVNQIVGSDSIANNTKKGFKLATENTPLNWELDLEILQTLPYGTSQYFAINFYHPGGNQSPKYYLYEVIGETDFKTASGLTIPCRQLKIEYGTKNSAVFWISKNTNQVIRMEEVHGPFKRYKFLLDH